MNWGRTIRVHASPSAVYLSIRPTPAERSPSHRTAPAGASAAATTLLKTMIDPNTPASVRVRAAECVMNHATKAIEIEDIEARVAALEQEAQETEQ